MKFKNYTVNVLGTDYTVEFKDVEDDPALEGLGGYVDYTVKKIVARIIKRNKDTYEDLSVHYKTVIKHELVHAFIYESGLDENSDWAKNEEMVSWVALQFEKMQKAFEQIK